MPNTTHDNNINVPADQLIATNNSINNIPKVIHYCWFGNKPLDNTAEKCLASWKKWCPDYQIIRWNESNFDVSNNLYCHEAYKSKKWAFVSDYFRLWVLYNHGGIYMDTDVEVIQPLNRFLVHDAFSGFEDPIHIPTGIIGAKAGNQWVQEMLEYYNNARFIMNNRMDLTTNVVTMTRLTSSKYPLRLDNSFQELSCGLVLYPFDWFCPKSLVTRRITLTNNTHTIHHFGGSWVNK